MHSINAIALQLTAHGVDAYCRELARRSPTPEKRVAALDALITFISTQVDPGEQARAEFVAIRQTLLDHFEQAREALLDERAQRLQQVLQARDLPDITALYTSLSRDAFWSLLGRVEQRLDAAALNSLRSCVSGWLAQARQRARDVHLNMKTVQHQPAQKLQDIIVNILANCSSIKQSDLRIRPDRVLTEAWGRAQFAEQSTLALTLNAFTAQSVNQLRQATETLYRQHGQVLHHNFADLLMLDIDLTGLPAFRHAQASEKGYFSGAPNTSGRQLLRVSAPAYHETLLSLLYPGAQSGLETFKPSIRAVQNLLQLTREPRRRIVWRTDGGLGSDNNINWALAHDYQVLMKGYNGKRATALARQIAARDWYALRDNRTSFTGPSRPTSGSASASTGTWTAC